MKKHLLVVLLFSFFLPSCGAVDFTYQSAQKTTSLLLSSLTRNTYDPRIPGNLQTTAVTSDQITLSWNSVQAAAGYRVYRSLSVNGTYSQIGGDITGTTFTNTSLTAGTTYWYKVSSFSTADEGPQSNAVSGTTLTGTTPGSDGSFVIAVFLQDPLRVYNGKINAVNYKNIGINTFLALYDWPNEAEMGVGYNLQAAQALKNNGMKVYAGNTQAAVNWNNAHPGRLQLSVVES